MENKDWREELKNLCKMQNIGISPNGGYIQELWYRSSHARLESLIEMILKSKQEEIEKAIENIEAPTDSVYELESLHEGYFKALDDLKPIISNILK